MQSTGPVNTLIPCRIADRPRDANSCSDEPSRRAVHPALDVNIVSSRRPQVYIGLTVEDVDTLTQKFWDLHIDPIAHLDGAVGTLVTIQVNLVAGTLARYAHDRPSLLPLIKKLLSYDIMGQFCLTEVNHGLDAANIETTATLLPDGGFALHTPHLGASKYMPPTNPHGIPCVAIVFAKLIVVGMNHGLGMCSTPSLSSVLIRVASLLPAREGSTPLNHCLTSFNHVYLPADALVGELESDTSRFGFLNSIWRVAVGTLALSGMTVPSLEISSYIAARYSQRRTVAGGVPIISFRTQHAPILSALAQGFVVREFWKMCARVFSEAELDPRLLHAYATIFKVTTTQLVQAANLALSERCGAQGLFAHNQITLEHVRFISLAFSFVLSPDMDMHQSYQANVRGITIAEGDTLVISIRLASELLLKRYGLPASTNPSSLLARHEQGLLAEHKALLAQHGGAHRSAAFTNLFLPNCEKIVSAIGHRMAYDAAVAAGLDSRVLDIFVASIVKLDAAWYSECAEVSRAAQAAADNVAVSAALPCLDEWLAAIHIEPYIKAPIVSGERWRAFVGGLEIFQGSEAEEPLRSRL
ncbi:hypothetical protein EWM64_g5393 [Hericium alpestre]|uniref:Acyl-CoA dehydrogenase NM domain-like protein n=1 Tax=Hericium alpestre TaxID=135208 RepID=A0A4Y9ZX31_9AGAM|nr:hypothetical protein EWM64_g5393 [Hericium alpestre]